MSRNCITSPHGFVTGKRWKAKDIKKANFAIEFGVKSYPIVIQKWKFYWVSSKAKYLPTFRVFVKPLVTCLQFGMMGRGKSIGIVKSCSTLSNHPKLALHTLYFDPLLPFSVLSSPLLFFFLLVFALIVNPSHFTYPNPPFPNHLCLIYPPAALIHAKFGLIATLNSYPLLSPPFMNLSPGLVMMAPKYSSPLLWRQSLMM